MDYRRFAGFKDTLVCQLGGNPHFEVMRASVGKLAGTSQ